MNDIDKMLDAIGLEIANAGDVHRREPCDQRLIGILESMHEVMRAMARSTAGPDLYEVAQEVLNDPHASEAAKQGAGRGHDEISRQVRPGTGRDA
jgi:hypothetical protein